MMRKHTKAHALPVWAFFILMLGLVFASFGNAIVHPFLIDDHTAIGTHPVVQGQQHWTLAFSQDYWAGQADDQNLYRPLTVLSYRMNLLLTGESAAAFRMVNMLLLAILAWLSFCYVRCFLPTLPAVTVGVLLCIHPANAELINHIVGRADLLVMIGIILFLLTQYHAISRNQWTRLSVLMALFACLLALGSKELGLILIPAAIAQAWVLKMPQEEERPSMRGVMVVLYILAGGLLTWLVLRTMAVGVWPSYAPVWATQDLTGNPLRAMGFAERLPVSLSLGVAYVMQLVMPDLRFHQTPAVLAGWSDWQVWLGGGLLLLLAAGWLVAWRQRHALLPTLTWLGAAWLLLGHWLMPTGVLLAGRLYLPFLLGTAVVAAWAVHKLVQWKPSLRIAVVVLVAVFCVGLWMTTVLANEHWSSVQARMQADYERQPEHPASQYLLAAALLEQDVTMQTLVQARQLMEQALQQQPNSVQLQMHYAGVLAVMGDLAGATAIYEQILERYPEHQHARDAMRQVQQAYDASEALR